MRKIFAAGSLVVLASQLGCQNSNNLSERLDKIEAKLTQLENRPAAAPMPPQPEQQKTAYNIPVGNSYVKGNKDAPVAIAVFSDYQCPFCSRVDPLLNEALNDPELKDKVKVVFKHFPLSFHKEASPAAKAALAAGEQGTEMFWAMSEKMFANQRELTPENFKKWASEIKGLNLAKWEKSLKDEDAKWEKMIKEDMEIGVNNAKVRGTPSIFVGGWELRERSVKGIKDLLKKAQG